MTTDPSAPRQFVYESRSQSRLAPFLFVAGGLVCVAGAVLGFVFAVTRRPENKLDPFAQQTLTTVPVVLAIGALSYAAILFRTPRRIVLSIDGITLETPLKTRHIAWDEVDRVETDKTIAFVPGGDVKVLILRDAAGAKLAVLSGTVRHFADLSERLQRIVSKRTGNRTVNRQVKRKRRTAVLFLACGALMLTAGISLGLHSWRELSDRRRLDAEGVDTEATILKHYMYNGIAPWVEYKFRADDGKDYERRALLATRQWNRLEGAETVAVRYVGSDPTYSRVADGEQSSGPNDDPKLTLILAPLGTLMSLLFFLAGVLRWKGLDLTFDEKKSRFRLKRPDGDSPSGADGLGAAP
jgi:hypothetical protein